MLLRALRVRDLDPIESLCFSVGLSLAIIMFSGLFANTVYPLLGVSEPISTIPLVITFTALVVVLSSIVYIRDKDSTSSPYELSLSPSLLFLTLLPFFGIVGANLVDRFESNLLLMFSLPIAGLIPVLIAFDIIKERLYPIAIFTTSLFLLYHTSLISPHIWGWDINLEYHFSNRVLTNAYWDSSLYGSINGMPAIVILAPTYATLCNIDLVWVFKVVYPFLFSFVPLAMYSIFEKMIDKKASTIACFLLMFSSSFYFAMLQLARQQIAELFLALIILSILSKSLKGNHKFLFLATFGISLIMSHYGTAYLFMFILIAYFVLLTALSQISRFYRQSQPLSSENSALRLPFIATYIVVTLLWYMYTAGSHPFQTLVYSAHIILKEFINPYLSDAFHFAIRRTVSLLHDVTKILYHITQFLIVLGILDLLRGRIKNIRGEYFLLSIVFFGIWIISAILPYYGFDFTRVYHITLIVLSPFCVIGAFTAARFLSSLTKKELNITASQALKLVSILFCAFLLFNSGWVYELAKDNPSSFVLSEVDYPVFNEQEIAGAKWLHEFKGDGKIYADDYRWLLFIGFEGYPYTWYGDYRSQHSELYIFLGTFNVKNGTILEVHEVGPRISVKEYVEVSKIIEQNKIYDSGAQIFLRTEE
ncbi:MAG: DUF2206 domain-containing protein [Archaeoglobaceae archaeon]